MQTRRGGGDPPGGQREPGFGRRLPTWENVHAFLQVIEHGSFSAAARIRSPTWSRSQNESSGLWTFW